MTSRAQAARIERDRLQTAITTTCFTSTPTVSARSQAQTLGELLQHANIERLANRGELFAWPSVGTIADRTHLSPQTVRRSLKALHADGWIEPETGTVSKGGSGKNATTRWLCCITRKPEAFTVTPGGCFDLVPVPLQSDAVPLQSGTRTPTNSLQPPNASEGGGGVVVAENMPGVLSASAEKPPAVSATSAERVTSFIELAESVYQERIDETNAKLIAAIDGHPEWTPQQLADDVSRLRLPANYQSVTAVLAARIAKLPTEFRPIAAPKITAKTSGRKNNPAAEPVSAEEEAERKAARLERIWACAVGAPDLIAELRERFESVPNRQEFWMMKENDQWPIGALVKHLDDDDRDRHNDELNRLVSPDDPLVVAMVERIEALRGDWPEYVMERFTANEAWGRCRNGELKVGDLEHTLEREVAGGEVWAEEWATVEIALESKRQREQLAKEERDRLDDEQQARFEEQQRRIEIAKRNDMICALAETAADDDIEAGADWQNVEARIVWLQVAAHVVDEGIWHCTDWHWHIEDWSCCPEEKPPDWDDPGEWGPVDETQTLTGVIEAAARQCMESGYKWPTLEQWVKDIEPKRDFPFPRVMLANFELPTGK